MFCCNSGVWPKGVASLSWRSGCKGVELAGYRHGFAVGAVHLPLADHVHGFDSGDDDSCTPKRLESEYRPGDSFDGSMVLLDDVVEVFALTHQDIDAGVSLDAINGCCVGATLVDSDLLWRIVQVVGTFQKSLGTSHLEIGFIHPPTLANGVLAPTKYGGQHRHHLDCPAMHSGVVNENTVFPHHLFNVTQAQRIGHVPSQASQHHFQRVVESFENFV